MRPEQGCIKKGSDPRRGPGRGWTGSGRRSSKRFGAVTVGYNAIEAGFWWVLAGRSNLVQDVYCGLPGRTARAREGGAGPKGCSLVV